jgi:sulfur relay protein TusB/DsrH
MLHLISQSPIVSAVLARVAVDDEIVFLCSAVLRLLQTGADHHSLSQLLKTHQLYVLADDLAVRGITPEELIQGIKIIDYTELVALTVKHPVIQSWT